MLQRLLLITLTLCSLTASAQWQQTGSKVRYVNGLGIPTKDTAAGVAADSSQILIRPADSSLYVRYKRAWQKVGAGGGGISGSGTTNYVPKFTSSSAIGNSQIFDNGTNVGIGTASPGQRLDVAGAAQFGQTGSGSFTISMTNNDQSNVRFRINNTGTGGQSYSFVGGNPAVSNSGLSIYDETNAATRLHITSGGNVGIGYTSPATKLSVNGTTLINTNTDNGVDKLQVSGSASISSLLKVTGGGIRLGVAGTSESLSTYLGSSNDAYPLVNNAYVVPGVGWKYLGNGPASMFGYVSSDLIYYNAATNSSGADATLGTWTERFMVKSGGNVLIATTSDNGVDELQVNGSISGIGFKQAYVTKTGAYTATNDDYVIDCTSGTFTVTLPASSGRTGRILIIKNSGAGTITVDGNGSETIDGATTYSLSVQYATIQIISDGTNWKIISKF
jgi:hypothetical protein